jgi:hypothetical protein
MGAMSDIEEGITDGIALALKDKPDFLAKVNAFPEELKPFIVTEFIKQTVQLTDLDPKFVIAALSDVEPLPCIDDFGDLFLQSNGLKSKSIWEFCWTLVLSEKLPPSVILDHINNKYPSGPEHEFAMICLGAVLYIKSLSISRKKDIQAQR